jgi:hypothetical protein
MIASPEHDIDRPVSQHTARYTRWGGWLGLLLLAGHLIFCHGCHGDEDNELCVPPRLVPRQHEAPPSAGAFPAQEKTPGRPGAD